MQVFLKDATRIAKDLPCEGLQWSEASSLLNFAVTHVVMMARANRPQPAVEFMRR